MAEAPPDDLVFPGNPRLRRQPNTGSLNYTYETPSDLLDDAVRLYITNLQKDLKDFEKLPEDVKRMMGMPVYERRIANIRKAIDSQERFRELFAFLAEVAPGEGSNEIANVVFLNPEAQAAFAAQSHDIELVDELNKQLFRHWSACNEHVLDTLHRPVVEVVRRHTKDVSAPKILVPGDGLFRLSYELLKAMPAAHLVACELSVVLVLVGGAILNKMQKPFSDLVPFAYRRNNHYDASSQYASIDFPCPLPQGGELPSSRTGKLDIVNAPFPDFFSGGAPMDEPSTYDAVVTCFFLEICEQRTNVFASLVTIHRLLAEGGVWVNQGPLDFHPSIRPCFSFEEIEGMMVNLGFDMLHKERVVGCYDQSVEQGSMRCSNLFNTVRFVARKRGAAPAPAKETE